MATRKGEFVLTILAHAIPFAAKNAPGDAVKHARERKFGFILFPTDQVPERPVVKTTSSTSSFSAGSPSRREAHCWYLDAQDAATLSRWLGALRIAICGDPHFGSKFRAVSVHHLCEGFMNKVLTAGFPRRAKIYQIEEKIIVEPSKDVICPRDGRRGAAYVDCIHGVDNVGLATIMLSYTWGYAVEDISDGLRQFCKTHQLNPRRTYCWICCLCINQHRVKEAQQQGQVVDFETFKNQFSESVRSIGRVVALMAPWRQPEYIKRVWCTFELFTAVGLQDCDCKLMVTMPPRQFDDLKDALLNGSGIDEMWRTLAHLDVRQADASVQQDKDNILKLIENGSGFHKMNSVVSEYLQEWVVQSCESHLAERLQKGDISDADAAQLCLHTGHLLRLVGRQDMMERAAQTFLRGLERAPPSGVTRAELLAELGRTHLAGGDAAAAENAFEEARSLYELANHLESLAGARLLTSMGVLQRRYPRRCEDKSKALETLEKAEAMLERLGALASQDGAEVIAEVGDALRRTGDTKRALEVYERARTAYELVGMLESPQGARLLTAIGITLDDRGEMDSALQVYKKARMIREKTSTLNTADGAKLLTGIGNALLSQGQLEDSLSILEQARQIFQATATLETNAGAVLMQTIGDVRFEEQKWEAALEAYTQACHIRELRDSMATGNHCKRLLERKKEAQFRCFRKRSTRHFSEGRLHRVSTTTEGSGSVGGGSRDSLGPEVPEGCLSVVTWNVAAINNNPFEFWMTLENSDYADLLSSFEKVLEAPDALQADLPIHDVFSDALFSELSSLMHSEGWTGIQKVERVWRQDLRHRRIVSEFLQDREISTKRLVSMPDRITGSIEVVSRTQNEYRPTVVNNYLGSLGSVAEWWLKWRRFMFMEHLRIPTKKGSRTLRPCQLLRPLSRVKYPALTQEEEEVSIPLQCLCQAIFDASLVHLMNLISPDGRWEEIKRSIVKSLLRDKSELSVEILRGSYSETDVICIQESSSQLWEVLKRVMSSDYHIIRAEACRQSQESLVLLRKERFPDAVVERTKEVLGHMGPKAPVQPGDLLVVQATDDLGRCFLIASFHGDSSGLSTNAVVTAVAAEVTELRISLKEDVRLVFGLDANTILGSPKEALGVEDFLAHCDSLGIRSCFTGPMEMCRTTCKARTFLQPQLHKAVRAEERMTKADRNPKDHILVQKEFFDVVSCDRDNQGQFGERVFKEDSCFPTLHFPSDHGVVSATLKAAR